MLESGWLAEPLDGGQEYQLSETGEQFFSRLGIEVKALSALRRRFACPCLDWSMRRLHLGGALGAALLQTAIRRKWVTQDLDSRALALTVVGRKEIAARFAIEVPAQSTEFDAVVSSPGSLFRGRGHENAKTKEGIRQRKFRTRLGAMQR
jgi:hypothetical protein